MNLLRRLEALANPLLDAYTDATGISAAVAVAETTSTRAGDAYLFEVLGFFADNPGVIDHTTPGLPTRAARNTTMEERP